MAKNISFTLKYWRQNGPREKGHFDVREMHDIPDDTSFLEMLDILNEELINEGQEPFVFDHDCREGICGMCSLYINGHPHGPATGATTCQLYMRRFNDGDVITVEPNGSAMLFVSSKVSQLALLPQGRPEAAKRAKNMVMKMEELGFGNCTNTRACEAECPKNESISNIARLNREFIKAEFIKAKLND